MTNKPVAAGKSSFDHIDQDLALSNIISPIATAYVDLACGAGRYTLALAERIERDDNIIYALDIWEDGIASLKDTALRLGMGNIEATVADITGPLPLDDDAADVCLIATALHDLPPDSREALLEEVVRILAPQGALVVIEFKKIDHGPGPGIAKRIGEAELAALLAPHGFAEVVSVSLGEYTYLAKFALA